MLIKCNVSRNAGFSTVLNVFFISLYFFYNAVNIAVCQHSPICASGWLRWDAYACLSYSLSSSPPLLSNKYNITACLCALALVHFFKAKMFLYWGCFRGLDTNSVVCCFCSLSPHFAHLCTCQWPRPHCRKETVVSRCKRVGKKNYQLCFNLWSD